MVRQRVLKDTAVQWLLSVLKARLVDASHEVGAVEGGSSCTNPVLLANGNQAHDPGADYHGCVSGLLAGQQWPA